GNNTMADFSATSGEPIIKSDTAGNIFVTSPFGLSTTVGLLWKSADGGRSFVPLGSPIVRDSVTAPGGGDTDIDFDANNWLYYVDLSGAWVAGFGNGIAYVTWRNLTGSNFWLFKTTDGGLTWDKGTLLGTVSAGGPLRADKQKRKVVVNGVERDAVILYQLFYRGNNLRVFRVTDLLDGSPLKIDD